MPDPAQPQTQPQVAVSPEATATAAAAIPASAQPATSVATPAPEADINDVMRRMVNNFRDRQVSSSVASNESDDGSLTVAAPVTNTSSAPKSAPDAASDDAADDQALGAAETTDDAATADPARKSRRQLAQEEREAELQQLRAQVEAEQAERLKLQQDAAARESKDAQTRAVVAEAIGTDAEYQGLLTRKARESDLGFLSAEDEQKLARWAANREILQPALDLSRNDAYSSGRAEGAQSLIVAMDAEVTALAGELQVPVSAIAEAKSFSAIARVFHDHAAANLTAAEQRVKELSDTNAALETELSALRAKSAGAGRIPERGGQPSSVAPKADLRTLPPMQRAAEALRQQMAS